MALQYVTVAGLVGVMAEQAIIDLTDDFRTGAVDASVLERCEGAAVADLELYAAKYYSLPLPVAPAVVSLVVQLTKCHLYMRRQVVPEEVQGLYKTLMRKLEQLTPSSLGLPGVDLAAGVGAGVSVSAPDQRFFDNFIMLE